ncbi:DUF2860 family protein [Desulfoluna spongiiphila]|uniref:DUF2860 domain-containing protein n=1 Tax=Desulfoluna spongiiphila TaxID=419481 RepID=A0A1G5HBZ2_9BACT|nr:DUF2860 family protein [Desulfoluna spongiiphila]SCY61385.1 Protein of unknown function [Desulfoluna spongiiphila]VVS94620.1 protein of unknown function duf2860 [Desulfoluna spongiiphila]
MKRSWFLIALVFFLAAITMPAYAIQPIPEETGFSGFVNVGIGAMEFETNMIAGNSMGDTGDDTITSLTDSPDSESSATPVLNFEASYTFAETRTQIFAGNRLEDLVRYDLSTLVGIRQELPRKSIVSIAYVFTSFPTEVWEDPYVINQKREKTDRTSDGLRLGYDKILGSKFEAEFTWRDVNLDDETSGQTQLISSGDITANEAKLLDRNGDVYVGKLSYPFVLREKRHVIVPTLDYTMYDLDGDAMSFDRYGLLLSYLFNTEKFNLITNLYLGLSEFDEENPIYDKTREDDVAGATFSAFWKKFLGVPKMSLVGTIAYYNSDSDIDFYDTTITMGTVSVLYRF